MAITAKIGGRVRIQRGFGSVRYIGSGRNNPYAVHPPSKRIEENGKVRYERQKALCYVPDWHTGFAVLTAWHAGAYTPGMEKKLIELTRGFGTEKSPKRSAAERRISWETYCLQIQEWSLQAAKGDKSNPEKPTVKDVYERFYESKFGEAAPRRLAPSTAKNADAIFKKLAPIHQRCLDDLTVDDLQHLVSTMKLGKTMVSKTVTMIKALYKYALSRGMCETNPAQYVIMPYREDYKHHLPFSDEDLATLWRHQDDPVVAMMLVMCYSGFRIGAFEGHMTTNLKERYFKGGIKTAAGRDRMVPIHHAILPLLMKMRKADSGEVVYLDGKSASQYRRDMGKKLLELGIDGAGVRHTPHSCRHTFSRLCESCGVREADRKRMMGHSFGSDITNGVYGHRTLEELREEIEKITC